jgi:hypothetical protein
MAHRGNLASNVVGANSLFSRAMSGADNFIVVVTQIGGRAIWAARCMAAVGGAWTPFPCARDHDRLVAVSAEI